MKSNAGKNNLLVTTKEPENENRRFYNIKWSQRKAVSVNSFISNTYFPPSFPHPIPHTPKQKGGVMVYLKISDFLH